MFKENRNKIFYLVLTVVVIIGLIILLLVMFNKKKTTKPIQKPAKVTESVKKTKKEARKEEVVHSNKTKKEKLEIVSEDYDLSKYQAGLSINLKLIYTDKNGEKKDVTKEAKWVSEKPALISIANSPDDLKGQMVAQKPGKGSVYAEYQGLYTTLPIEVKRPELKIHCNVDKTQAKVGEPITWLFIYDKPGMPNYLYKTTGDDGLKSDQPIFSYSYKTPGVKHSHMETTDRAGTKAEADCPSITIVQ